LICFPENLTLFDTCAAVSDFSSMFSDKLSQNPSGRKTLTDFVLKILAKICIFNTFASDWEVLQGRKERE